MSGLLLGLIGGAVASGSTTVGGASVFFKKKFSQDVLLKFRLDFFIGLMLAISAFSSLSWLVVISLFLGIFFIKFSKLIISNIFLTSIALNSVDQKSVFLLLLIMLKNIPEGMAAGASMTLTNVGASYSLLTIIGIQDIIDGTIAALCFLSLGLSPVVAFLGALGTGAIELFAAVFGGYIGKEIAELLPLTMAFAAGAMMSSTLEELLIQAKEESRKILLSPRFARGVVVMFIFIIWKELL